MGCHHQKGHDHKPLSARSSDYIIRRRDGAGPQAVCWLICRAAYCGWIQELLKQWCTCWRHRRRTRGRIPHNNAAHRPAPCAPSPTVTASETRLRTSRLPQRNPASRSIGAPTSRSRATLPPWSICRSVGAWSHFIVLSRRPDRRLPSVSLINRGRGAGPQRLTWASRHLAAAEFCRSRAAAPPTVNIATARKRSAS
jgi:hypothetical protein